MNVIHCIGKACAERSVAILFLGCLLSLAPVVQAVPHRLIILRHGEKANEYALTAIGQQRALALQANYLGKNAAQSLFPDGTAPAAIFAITLHSLELISPAAQSWDMPIQLYSVVPGDGCTPNNEVTQLNQRTQQAAHDILTNPRWHGKTIVIAWEHDHIAREALEQQFPNERVTLRQLLNLDQLPPAFKVPTTWPGDNYDYFWIVVYPNPESPIPNAFTMQKQIFPAPYQQVPRNDWGQPEPRPAASSLSPSSSVFGIGAKALPVLGGGTD
ncbi:MAG: histidine phosphatase family protein [bacterium]